MASSQIEVVDRAPPSSSSLAVVAPGPGLVAVKPVVDGGGVGLGAVEEVGAEALGGEVAPGVEDAPPHAAAARRRRRRRRRRHRRGRGRRHRLRRLHRLPRSCVDGEGLGGGGPAELVEARAIQQ